MHPKSKLKMKKKKSWKKPVLTGIFLLLLWVLYILILYLCGLRAPAVKPL